MSIKRNNEIIAGRYKQQIIPYATNTVAGIIRIATDAEITIAPSSTTAVVPTQLNAQLATKQNTLTAGSNIQITSDTISATDTTYTAGTNVQISDQNVISATDTTYTAGSNIQITNNTISATDTTYTAGDGLTLTGTEFTANIINNVTSTDTNKSLSANMGKELQDQISNLKARGRFLSEWNSTTGLPETNPTTLPYTYETGSYFIVGTVGTTNYKPTGSQYTGVASTTVETENVAVNDTYLYDGSVWKLLHGADVQVTFASIAGQPTDNSNLASALNAKQDTLTAGSNIQITNNTISATDTKYSTGTSSTLGLTKLYTSTGTNTDGTLTQKAIDSNYVAIKSVNQELNTFNSDKQYWLSSIHNLLYKADERHTVTITGASGNASSIFNGSFEYPHVNIGVGDTGIITITNSRSTGIFDGYNIGYVYLSFYWNNTPTSVDQIKVEILGTDNIWYELDKKEAVAISSSSSLNVIRCYRSLGYSSVNEKNCTSMRITVDNSEGTTVLILSEVEFFATRVSKINSFPVVTKYTDNEIIGNITAKKLITTNGTSSQFVKGDGSLDSNTYATASSIPTKISDLTDDTITNPIDKADTLTGLTATVTELNYCDGVTSNIQTQLNSKVNTLDVSSTVSYTTTNPVQSKAITEYIASRGENLITNGSQLLGTNYNWSSFTYDPSDSNGSAGCIKSSVINSIAFCNEKIPVDTTQTYHMSFDIKTDNGSARFYDTIQSYDIDGYEVMYNNVYWISGSTTTLAQELKAGDTKVYLTSIAGFDKTVTQDYKRGFIFWNYTNSKGYTWPTETYSRNRYTNLWADSSAFDSEENSITLTNAWTGPTIEAGTSLSQCTDGANYIYIGNTNYTLTPDTWVHRDSVLTPSLFRKGTAYVSVGWLLNRNVSEVTTKWTNICFSQKANYADLVTGLSGKQDTLTAGSNIQITNNTISATDTTYSTGTSSTLGLTKLYTSTGTNTDGTLTQKAIDSSYVAKTSVNQELNSFNTTNQYWLSSLHDLLYRADERYNVTSTGFVNTSSTSIFFNGSFEDTGNFNKINAGSTGVVLIENDDTTTGLFGSYASGYIYVSFYYIYAPTDISQVKVEMYSTRNATGWVELINGEVISTSTSSGVNYITCCRFRNNTNYVPYHADKIRVTVDNTSGTSNIRLNEIEFFSTRTDSIKRFPVVTKYTDSEIFGNVTATKHITKNGTSSQFVKGDGSLDSNSYQATLVSGTNIKTINSNSILGSGNLDIDALPSQSGQSGKYLTTDGSTASWATIQQATYDSTNERLVL